MGACMRSDIVVNRTSSGIGRAITLRLATAEHHIYAGVRRPVDAPKLGGVVVSVAAVAAVSGLIALLDPRVPALSLLVLYILAVLSVAVFWRLHWRRSRRS